MKKVEFSLAVELIKGDLKELKANLKVAEKEGTYRGMTPTYLKERIKEIKQLLK